MKTILTLLSLVSLSMLVHGQSGPSGLPPASDALVRQFETFETKTMDDARRNVNAARVKLLALLNDQANKAQPNDTAVIRAYMEMVKQEAREAEAPSIVEFWHTGRTVAGYYNNGPVIAVKVDTAGKKRFLAFEGNQASKKTNGEIFFVRDERNETKVGSWKAGAGGVQSFDVSGLITKPGEYRFKLKYVDGGDEFVCDRLGIVITK